MLWRRPSPDLDTSTLDKGIFNCAKEYKTIGIVACFADDVLWDGNEEFSCIIKQLKSIFKIGAEHKEMFDYIRVHRQQNTDCSIILDQNQYINTINLFQSAQNSQDNTITNFPKRKPHW